MLGLVDHVVVGHRIAVGRDEESGALAGVLPALWSATALLVVATTEALTIIGPTAIGQTETLAAIRRAETAEEILEGRPAQGIFFIEAQVVAARIDTHLDRDDGRLHFFHDVGKTCRALHALRVNGGKHGAAGLLRPQAEISEDRPDTKAGGGGKKNDAMIGKETRHVSGSVVIVLGKPVRALNRTKIWSVTFPHPDSPIKHL
jgi:hypothetical protein